VVVVVVVMGGGGGVATGDDDDDDDGGGGGLRGEVRLIKKVRIQWDREEVVFIVVRPTFRRLHPAAKVSKATLVLSKGTRVAPSTSGPRSPQQPPPPPPPSRIVSPRDEAEDAAAAEDDEVCGALLGVAAGQVVEVLHDEVSRVRESHALLFERAAFVLLALQPSGVRGVRDGVVVVLVVLVVLVDTGF